MELKEKIVLLTGGANGIGFACATELLRNGVAHVAILDLSNANGEKAASKLSAEFGKGKAIFVVCDVTKPEELEAGFAKTVEEFGGLDIVINNAGIMDDSRWELMININYIGVVRGTLLGMKYMGKDRGNKGGTIVNTASLMGLLPLQAFPIYSGTKHAVIGLTRSFGQPYHYEKTGIRMLVLCPGLTETQLVTKKDEKLLDFVTPDVFSLGFDDTISQTADAAAKALVHVIKVGENGGVWAIAEGLPVCEIDVPDQPIKKVPVVKNQN